MKVRVRSSAVYYVYKSHTCVCLCVYQLSKTKTSRHSPREQADCFTDLHQVDEVQQELVSILLSVGGELWVPPADQRLQHAWRYAFLLVLRGTRRCTRQMRRLCMTCLDLIFIPVQPSINTYLHITSKDAGIYV